ncbi:MAG: hypothetical protein CTY15_08665 [Methylocystis sp.]|nr:MAG: hypothetical protein CTY15_08665 [Methylocystis sp.]
MKAPVVFLAAALAQAPVSAAEWLLVSQDGFSKIYIDPASRKIAGDIASVAALTDYDPRAPEAASFKLSEKGLSEIESVRLDCGRRQYSSGGGRWFAGQMADGAARSDYPAKTAWSKVPSFYDGLYAKVCAKN